MLYAVNTSAQTLTEGNTIALGAPSIKTGCTATMSGSSVLLNKPGFYKVTFTAIGATAAANVVVNMLRNGNTVPGWTSSAYSAADTEDAQLVIDAIVQVEPNETCNKALSSAILTFVAGAPENISNTTISVTKLA